MKFNDMPYERCDCEQVKKDIKAFTKELKKAKSYEEAKAVLDYLKCISLNNTLGRFKP